MTVSALAAFGYGFAAGLVLAAMIVYGAFYR